MCNFMIFFTLKNSDFLNNAIYLANGLFKDEKLFQIPMLIIFSISYVNVITFL
jgi:hypothetical protein